MQSQSEKDKCQLIVIGTGMAGMCAALFAAHHKIDTIQVGMTGELSFASGLFDLLGVHPMAKGVVITNPWKGIKKLCKDEPCHPYVHLKPKVIRRLLDMVTAFFKEADYPYVVHSSHNATIMTPVGTLKTTYAVPHSMAFGPLALTRKLPCLLVDLDGLKGFSAHQIAKSLSHVWSGLRPVRVSLPDTRDDLYAEHLARALDVPKNCQMLAAVIKPHLKDALAVALPAVLGVHHTLNAMAILTRELGVPVFEVPTMLPGVAGLRLLEIFEKRLPFMGIRSLYQHKIFGVSRTGDGNWCFDIGRQTIERQVVARSAVLCSGRFLGGGLHAERHEVRETIFNLPVIQPPEREQWHHKDLFDPQGHPINRSGVAVDNRFRPVDAAGQAIFPNLFAAGTILAHQDWMRQKCGSGLAIATAYGAVEACRNFLDNIHSR
jgi:glycerol-3-phosphate dehydrogenase subunit B